VRRRKTKEGGSKSKQKKKKKDPKKNQKSQKPNHAEPQTRPQGKRKRLKGWRKNGKKLWQDEQGQDGTQIGGHLSTGEGQKKEEGETSIKKKKKKSGTRKGD